MVKAQVCIALGTNLGDRPANLAQAVERLESSVSVTSRSYLYETEPWGFTDQPRFLNAVVRGESALLPLELLRALKSIETEMGRKPTFRNGPRLIDMDLLDYGGWAFQSRDLVLPHPRLHERLFVLQPLSDVSAGWVHPGNGLTALQMRDAVLHDTADSVRRWVEPTPGWVPGPF